MTPTRNPLDWPVGWKRTPEHQRVEGKFRRYDKRLSVFDGVERVLQELERLGVSENDVVISTNLQTRLDGLPRSDQAKPADPGVCVYWQKGKAPMRCMAVDQYENVADNLAAVAATLEAMRAIERHGGAAILDRAFTGFAALPAPIVASMSRPWREVLGFGAVEVVNEPLVQARYRYLASQHHPDRDGSAKKMAEINVARDAALREIRS